MTTSAPFPRGGQSVLTVTTATGVRAAGRPSETGEALTANRRVPQMQAATGATRATAAGQTARTRRAKIRVNPVVGGEDSSGAERATTTERCRRASGPPSRPGVSRRAALPVHADVIREKRTTKRKKAASDSWAGEVKTRIKARLMIPGVMVQEVLRRAKALS
jgi:hypothetical protein